MVSARALDRLHSGRPDLGRPERRWTSQAAHEEGGESPAWSPDGRQIAFLRRDPKGGRYLWVLDRRGGRARRLGDEPVEPVGYAASQFLASPPEWQSLPR
jgi:dipeptidyl aminopeptidase/acylaminoacyl peptidase